MFITGSPVFRGSCFSALQPTPTKAATHNAVAHIIRFLIPVVLIILRLYGCLSPASWPASVGCILLAVIHVIQLFPGRLLLVTGGMRAVQNRPAIEYVPAPAALLLSRLRGMRGTLPAGPPSLNKTANRCSCVHGFCVFILCCFNQSFNLSWVDLYGLGTSGLAGSAARLRIWAASSLRPSLSRISALVSHSSTRVSSG